MRLTPELVSQVARHVEDPGPMPGRIYASDADYDATMRALLGGRPPSGVIGGPPSVPHGFGPDGGALGYCGLKRKPPGTSMVPSSTCNKWIARQV